MTRQAYVWRALAGSASDIRTNRREIHIYREKKRQKGLKAHTIGDRKTRGKCKKEAAMTDKQDVGTQSREKR
jgi:hypothetical protein